MCIYIYNVGLFFIEIHTFQFIMTYIHFNKIINSKNANKTILFEKNIENYIFYITSFIFQICFSFSFFLLVINLLIY